MSACCWAFLLKSTFPKLSLVEVEVAQSKEETNMEWHSAGGSHSDEAKKKEIKTENKLRAYCARSGERLRSHKYTRMTVDVMR